MIPAGTEVTYTVTFLEMSAPPAGDPPPLPGGYRLDLAEAPPAWYFLALYGAVGRDWEWCDRFEEGEAALAAYVADPDVELWTLIARGWPQGFFQLDLREPGTADLAYFGLVPGAVGRGIGSRLLRIALARGWARDGVARMTVNTCTLDHPAALGLYRGAGFEPVRTEQRRRVLTRDRVAPLAESA